jgi:hypothetical protein
MLLLELITQRARHVLVAQTYTNAALTRTSRCYSYLMISLHSTWFTHGIQWFAAVAACYWCKVATTVEIQETGFIITSIAKLQQLEEYHCFCYSKRVFNV